MRVIAIIQARMGSTRLPGKVLMDLAGEPMLARVANRARRAVSLNEVVIATTTEPADNAIEDLCRNRMWPCFRGSRDDLLERYYHAAMAYNADVVVRITSDCPLIDPGVVDRVVGVFTEQQPGIDYVSNGLPMRTFPRGLDTEVMSLGALGRAWTECRDLALREHVTIYIKRHPDRFRMHGVTCEEDYSYMRWTVDTAEDLTLVRRIYKYFGHDRFSWREVLAVLEEHPDWCEINSHVAQKEV